MMAANRRRVFLVGVAALLFPWAAGRAEAPAKGMMEIYFIDVMGGAATLIVTPEKESILIDSGWTGFDDRDPKRIVHVLKDLAGCDHLDHLVTTHWHTDHYGGVAGLSRMIEIRRFWDRGLPEDHDPAFDFPDGPASDDPLGIAYRQASKGKRSPLKAGDTIPLGGGLTALVLAGGAKVMPPPTKTSPNAHCDEAPTDQAVDPSDNARSLALRFRFGKFDFLDCGDLTWNIEKALVCPQDVIGPIDLYQVTHHGMDISNHPTLIETIRPTVAVMNNGPKKGGSAATVRRLQGIPSIQAAYQLHRNAETRDEDNTEPELIANRDPAGGQFIQVSVAPDGSRFNVRIGAEGVPREFVSR